LQSQLLVRQRYEGWWFEASLGKTLVKASSQQKKKGMTVHTCQPSYKGDMVRRIAVQASWAKMRELI
jgi:hypothetical protein